MLPAAWARHLRHLQPEVRLRNNARHPAAAGNTADPATAPGGQSLANIKLNRRSSPVAQSCTAAPQSYPIHGVQSFALLRSTGIFEVGRGKPPCNTIGNSDPVLATPRYNRNLHRRPAFPIPTVAALSNATVLLVQTTGLLQMHVHALQERSPLCFSEVGQKIDVRYVTLADQARQDFSRQLTYSIMCTSACH